MKRIKIRFGGESDFQIRKSKYSVETWANALREGKTPHNLKVRYIEGIGGEATVIIKTPFFHNPGIVDEQKVPCYVGTPPVIIQRWADKEYFYARCQLPSGCLLFVPESEKEDLRVCIGIPSRSSTSFEPRKVGRLIEIWMDDIFKKQQEKRGSQKEEDFSQRWATLIIPLSLYEKICQISLYNKITITDVITRAVEDFWYSQRRADFLNLLNEQTKSLRQEAPS